MSLTASFYARLPVWAQHSAVSLYGLYRRRLRFGGIYHSAVQEYVAREWLSSDEWARYQRRQLRTILSESATRVPYYRDAWSKTERTAAQRGVLNELPLVEKEALRKGPGSFVRDDQSFEHRHTFQTSGSTGAPITTFWTTDEVRRSRAIREARSHRWAGVSFGVPRATFSGRMVEPDPQSAGPFHRYNLFERQVYFSAFHLRPDTASQYVGALRRHKTRFLTGYAVSWYGLAKEILRQGLVVPPIKAVVTTSEKVTDSMRDVMEEAYGCKVYEEYSSVENLMLATECEAGSLHVSPDYGVVEILGQDGRPCDPEEVGEVVVTGLMRRFQPLIRFRLGDLAAWASQPCSCGRAMPVLKEVVGRLEDVVVGPDGREMVRFHGVFVGQDNIREGQVVQETLNLIRVNIVPTADFSARDVEEIQSRVRSRLGSDIQVLVHTVPAIPRSSSGKFRSVISHVTGQASPRMPPAGKVGDP